MGNKNSIEDKIEHYKHVILPGLRKSGISRGEFNFYENMINNIIADNSFYNLNEGMDSLPIYLQKDHVILMGYSFDDIVSQLDIEKEKIVVDEHYFGVDEKGNSISDKVVSVLLTKNSMLVDIDQSYNNHHFHLFFKDLFNIPEGTFNSYLVETENVFEIGKKDYFNQLLQNSIKDNVPIIMTGVCKENSGNLITLVNGINFDK